MLSDEPYAAVRSGSKITLACVFHVLDHCVNALSESVFCSQHQGVGFPPIELVSFACDHGRTLIQTACRRCLDWNLGQPYLELLLNLLGLINSLLNILLTVLLTSSMYLLSMREKRTVNTFFVSIYRMALSKTVVCVLIFSLNEITCLSTPKAFPHRSIQ